MYARGEDQPAVFEINKYFLDKFNVLAIRKNNVKIQVSSVQSRIFRVGETRYYYGLLCMIIMIATINFEAELIPVVNGFLTFA